MSIESSSENFAAATPQAGDVVLGGDARAPLGSAVLGGFSGLKQRFETAPDLQRAKLLQTALGYGQAGLDLTIAALQDPSELVQRTAYLLLQPNSDPTVRQALQGFNPYRLFTCLRTLKGGGLQAVLSADGAAIAVVSGKTIKVWNLENGDLLYTVPHGAGRREYFALSPDRQTLVRSTSGDQHRVEVWQNGELIHTLYGHAAPIRTLAISPDSQIVATGSDDRTIRLWHLKTGKSVWTIDQFLTRGIHTGPISELTFTPNGSMLISASLDQTLKVWSLQSRDRIRSLKIPGDLRALTVSPDGRWLAAGCWRKILIWDTQTGQVTQTLEGHSAGVFHLSFSPDGCVLASSDNYNPEIFLWNLTTGRILNTLADHQGMVSGLGFTWDSQTLISCGADKTIRFWGVASS